MNSRPPSVWSKVLQDLNNDEHGHSLFEMTETTYDGRGGGCHVDADSLNMGIEYTTNSLNYRSPEVGDTPADILAIGCSQTFGMGVQDNEIWPEKLSNMLGMSYVNLGECGSSIYNILGQAMSYVRDIGKPKVIVALLPGWDRVEIAVNHENNLVSPEIFQVTDKYQVYQMNMSSGKQDTQEVPKYAKRPYILDEVLSYEIPLSQSAKALSHLMSYCSAIDVPLVFSSWHPNMIELLDIKAANSKTKWDLTGYVRFDPNTLVDLQESKISGLTDMICHHDAVGVDSPSWEIGQDKGRHIGAHAHLHYAEAFRDMILDRLEMR